MNRAQRLIVVLALPALVFLPFYGDTSCFRANWRCEETRPFVMALAGAGVLIVSGLLLRFDFARLRRRPLGMRIAVALPVVALLAMAVFLDTHGGSDLFDDLRLPLWWIVLAVVTLVELWLFSVPRDRRSAVVEGEFSEVRGSNQAIDARRDLRKVSKR